MGDLVRYNAQQSGERIQRLTGLTEAAQREIGRIYAEGTEIATQTLTATSALIQAAATGGMSQAQVAQLREQQQQYLAEIQQLAANGAGAIAGVVSRHDRLLNG